MRFNYLENFIHTFCCHQYFSEQVDFFIWRPTVLPLMECRQLHHEKHKQFTLLRTYGFLYLCTVCLLLSHSNLN